MERFVAEPGVGAAAGFVDALIVWSRAIPVCSSATPGCRELDADVTSGDWASIKASLTMCYLSS
jgi:hypothetical protein